MVELLQLSINEVSVLQGFIRTILSIQQFESLIVEMDFELDQKSEMTGIQ